METKEVKKFFINVSGKNEQELEKRIKDNMKRGFVVYKRENPQVLSNNYYDYNKDSSGHVKRRKSTSCVNTTIKHKAVMVRYS